MTFSTILPILLFVAGWLAKHYALFGKVGSLLGVAAGPNPLAPSAPSSGLPIPAIPTGNHPILSDAVNAAIQQAVKDAVAGHISSLKDEILASAKAAAAAAAADIKAKV